jgi:hypothetical protein
MRMPNSAMTKLEPATIMMPTMTDKWLPETIDRIWPPTTLFTMLYPTLVKTLRAQQTLLG